jgi:CRISPR/Cas system CMR-associated protein Cmr5 small subunit
MASQKRNPITSKSTVHDTRKGRIEVSGNGLRLTTVFDISKEKQAEDFVTKVWEAKAKYPEALQQRNAEAAEIANDIAETKKQINQNIPLLADAHKELEDLEHNVQLAGVGINV